MKYLITILTILFTASLNAQWSFNTTSGTGIESPTNTASGDYAIAMGNYTTASGGHSAAMGYYAKANGVSMYHCSFAMGDHATASGRGSVAMGDETTASGVSSVAMGEYTEASGRGSVAMGAFTEASGSYSVAMGEYTEASGRNSTAMGYWTTASGRNSTAIGYETTAEDYGTFTIGQHNTADNSPNPDTFDMANRAFVIGNGIDQSNKSDAMTILFDGTTTIAGTVTAKSFISADNDASGSYSTALGENCEASGYYSIAMGGYTTASANNSIAMGFDTTASGHSSVAMGLETTAEDYGTFTIGRLNTEDSTPNPDTFDMANRAFVIGNGIDQSNKSDAMTILFDGTTTIAGDLNLNSDARLKSNIISLGSTLAKLLALDGKSYTFKTDESKQKIGLIAQDVQEVFPELVTEAQDEQGTLSVNYQGLIPVLINAIKEQQKEIEELKTEVNKLRSQ